MNARRSQIRNLLRVLLLLLVASAISFAVEWSRVHDGAEATGRIVAKRRVPHLVAPTGDSYEIIIEYQVNGHTRRFATPRAVWGSLGKLNTVGESVPVWYLPDGRAYLKGFVYLYPVTASLLALFGIGLISLGMVIFRQHVRSEG